jgi:hypothetical protein
MSAPTCLTWCRTICAYLTSAERAKAWWHGVRGAIGASSKSGAIQKVFDRYGSREPAHVFCGQRRHLILCVLRFKAPRIRACAIPCPRGAWSAPNLPAAPRARQPPAAAGLMVRNQAARDVPQRSCDEMSARYAGRAAEHSQLRHLIAPGGDDAVRIEHTADAVEEKIMRAACRWQRVHRLDA